MLDLHCTHRLVLGDLGPFTEKPCPHERVLRVIGPDPTMGVIVGFTVEMSSGFDSRTNRLIREPLPSPQY